MKPIAPWQAVAHLADRADFPDFDELDWAILESDPQFALRCDQHPPHPGWRYLGYLGGRGLGKSFALEKIITAEIDAGRIQHIALMAQNEDKTRELHIERLKAVASPWNKCREFAGHLYWDNGALGTPYTPEAPGNPRGFNGDFAWLSELVAWPKPTRREAFDNVITATRTGLARVAWDTTSKGQNELITDMMKLNEHNPAKYPIIRGQIFDNPLLGKDYLFEQCMRYSGRRREEELEGKVFTESEGAIYKLEWIDDNRSDAAPSKFELVLIGLDPGVSTKEGVDGTGLVVAGRKDGRFYVLRDHSDVLSGDQYADIVIDEHDKGAAGVVVETNKGGELTTRLIRARARAKGIDVRLLAKTDRWPRFTRGIIYVREVFSRNSKLERGQGPSAICEQGQISHVGTFPELEGELCGYDGVGPSPNRFDAYNQAIDELAELQHVRATHDVAKRVISDAKTSELLRVRLSALSRGRRVV